MANIDQMSPNEILAYFSFENTDRKKKEYKALAEELLRLEDYIRELKDLLVRDVYVFAFHPTSENEENCKKTKDVLDKTINLFKEKQRIYTEKESLYAEFLKLRANYLSALALKYGLEERTYGCYRVDEALPEKQGRRIMSREDIYSGKYFL